MQGEGGGSGGGKDELQGEGEVGRDGSVFNLCLLYICLIQTFLSRLHTYTDNTS